MSSRLIGCRAIPKFIAFHTFSPRFVLNTLFGFTRPLVAFLAAAVCFYFGFRSVEYTGPPSEVPAYTGSYAGPVPDLDPMLDSLFARHQPFLSDYRSAALLERDEAWIDSTLEALSLKEKIGQLLIVELNPNRLRDVQTPDDALRRFSPGGFFVSRTLDPETVIDVTNRLQQRSDVPLFFAADYERGAGGRANAFTEVPSNMGIGAARDPRLAEAAGMLTALEARAMGINLVLAPVVDINDNPENPIINIRSYGENPALVSEMAGAFVRGAEQLGVATTLKHFPGHGNTSVDTHVQLASVLGSWDELQATELAPYREVFAETGGPAAVMSAHLWTPGVDPTRRPATFSSVLLTDVLRDSLRFDGLVITDDIEMGALRQGYSYTERIVEPLRAGADIVLMPERVEEAVEALLEAVEDGRLTEERVDTSVRRVLRTKAQIGLHRSRLSSVLRFRSLYADAIGESVADAIAERAITQPARSDAIPLRERSRVALIQITNQRSSTTIRTGMELLGTLLSGRSEVESVRVAGRINRQLRQQVDEAVGNAEVVVLALYLRTIVGRRLGLTDAQAALARSVEASGKPFIVLTFGHPYATDSFPGSDGTLIAYEQSHASVRAVAAALNGTLLPTGELPVTLQRFPYGSGSP